MSSLKARVNTDNCAAQTLLFLQHFSQIIAQFLLHHSILISHLVCHCFLSLLCILLYYFSSRLKVCCPDRSEDFSVYMPTVHVPKEGEIESRNVGILTGRKWRGLNSACASFRRSRFSLRSSTCSSRVLSHTDLPIADGNKQEILQIGQIVWEVKSLMKRFLLDPHEVTGLKMTWAESFKPDSSWTLILLDTFSARHCFQHKTHSFTFFFFTVRSSCKCWVQYAILLGAVSTAM